MPMARGRSPSGGATNMDEDSRRFKLLVNVFGVYMITVGFAGIYFNWQFARTNGFVSWVLLGEVVPTAKAVVWPYFALRTHQQDKAEESLNHLFDALRQSQEAAKIINTAEPAASIYDMPGITRAVEHRRSAIAQIDQADAAVLDKVFPELGIRSHCQFRRAMELFVNG